MFVRLFQCIARAALANVQKSLLDNVPFGNSAYDFAKDVVKNWREAAPKTEDRVAELQELPIATPAMVLDQAEKAVAAIAYDQPEPIRRTLTALLTQLPGNVRRSLSRPADLTGTTVPPGLALDKAEDVLPFLPSRPPHKDLYAGKHFGDWELTERLGSGGFGEVWKAVHLHLPPVALKFCTDPVAAKSLRNEAALLGRVIHSGRLRGIVALQDTFLTHEPPYLRYDFVPGGELTSLVQGWKGLTPAERAKRSVEVMFRLATIVGFAHRLTPPIVHRDLKPANVLLQPSEKKGSYTLRVADFGIGGIAVAQARKETELGTTPAESLMSALRGSCTPLYASPEQMRGESPDPRDDVYSLGVMWYQLLVGDVTAARPGGRKWPGRLVEQGIDERLVELLGTCLEDARADRFADAAALAEELKRLMIPPPPDPKNGGVDDSGGRKEQTMKVLQRHGILSEGTQIEVMPDAISDDGPTHDPNFYRAHIGNPSSKKSVKWAHDDNAYSLTELSVKLEEYGLLWVRPKTFEL